MQRPRVQACDVQLYLLSPIYFRDTTFSLALLILQDALKKLITRSPKELNQTQVDVAPSPPWSTCT